MWKKPETKVSIVWFHLYKVQEQTKLTHGWRTQSYEREYGRAFWSAPHSQNLDLGCAHVKLHQAEHLRFVLLNIYKLFFNKNNVTYIKKIKAKHK